MNSADFSFHTATLTALPSGGLFWAEQSVLVVSDLHLGKSERIARKGGALLPPYETVETLTRLSDDLHVTRAKTVICLGDSFDDREAALALDETYRDTIRGLQAGRRWLWIEGNHDPGPLDLGGAYMAELCLHGLTFRHIAEPGAKAEVSGHYHPKARLRHISRPCFMTDATRLILPAYGCYTGGLDWTTPVLRALFDDRAVAYLTGPRVLAVPVPKAA
jgi:DNA ligase-associated metallophosphoesterase